MFSMSLLFTRFIAMCSGMIFEVLMITAFNMRTIDNYLIYLSPFSWSDLSIFGRKYDGMEYFNGTPTMGWCVGILLLLIWLDFGRLGLKNEELEDLIINKSVYGLTAELFLEKMVKDISELMLPVREKLWSRH